MTANQLQRVANLETARANKVREQQNEKTIAENQRHNYAQENEQNRHNIMTENIQRETNAINQRHLQNQDYTNLYSVQSNAEHLERQDVETQKHNRISETITSSYNSGMLSIGQQNADTNLINANTTQKHLVLDARDVATREAAQQSRSTLEGAQVIKTNTETKYIPLRTVGEIMSGLGQFGLNAAKVYFGAR